MDSPIPAPSNRPRTTDLSYGVVTPVLDEAAHLERLAECLAGQTRLPAAWIIVDQASTDGTYEIAASLADTHPWVVVEATNGGTLARGAPIVRAFQSGVEAFGWVPNLVVKVDADISVGPDHFERLLEAFAGDPGLGIAGGIGYEKQADGVWRQRHGTGPAVWGACRAYRRECLRDIMPLEEHMGWDTLDLMKANLRGWKTQVFYDLSFQHHRVEGERDGHRFRTSMIQGEAAHFMGYRVSYLAARTLYRAPRDPAALGLLVGFMRSRLARRPRCADIELRAFVRNEQRWRKLPLRIREALRPRAALEERLG